MPDHNPIINEPLDIVAKRVAGLHKRVIMRSNKKAPTVPLDQAGFFPYYDVVNEVGVPGVFPPNAVEGQLVQDQSSVLWWFINGMWNNCIL